MAIHGPSGSGKTYTALAIALALVDPGKRVAFVDTEHGSASKYSNDFDFDAIEITRNYHPRQVGEAIRAAADAGYGAIVIDSLTHFWNGSGGFLELVDAEVANMRARNQKPDSFAAWKVVDPVYRQMVQEILSAPIHVIVTLRAKTEYEKTTGENGGKGGIRKVGLAPEMRDNFQYEMDIEGMLSIDHDLVIGKTRCAALDGRIFRRPGADLAQMLAAWLNEGAEPATKPPIAVPTGDDVHDPSWADDRSRFCAAVGDLGFNYDDVKAWCLANKRPKPSAMPQARRQQLYDFLKSDAGAAMVRGWLQNNTSAAAK
jgi:hypothetical protein